MSLKVRAFGLVLLCLLTACASQAPRKADNSDEWRLTKLEESILNLQEKVQKLDAEIEDRVKVLENRIAGLEQELRTGRTMSASSAQPGEYDLQPEPQPTMQAETPADTQMQTGQGDDAAMQEAEELSTSIEMSQEEPAGDQPTAVGTETAATMQDSDEPAMRQEPGAEIYQQALDLTRAGRTTEARTLFNDFITRYPSSPLLPNALYWLGETHYHEKRYPQAVLTFKEVTRKFPQHGKAPAALLKIAYAYDRMDDKDNAVFYLQTLIDEYPDSEPADLAKAKLKALNR